MNLDKAPRWLLLTICSASLGTCSLLFIFVFRSACAEMQTVKTVAYSAKGLSVSNETAIADMRGSITKIQDSQETFRREYREDQKDLDRKLDVLLRRA